MSIHRRFLARFGAVAVFFWLAGIISASAIGSDWFARTWQSDDGLPDNNVTGVAQTVDGYLWVATQGGLARFDGVQFKRVALPAVSGTVIEMIRALTVCDGDHVWLALEGGVVMAADPLGTRVYTAANGLPWVRPTSVVQDGEGVMWVGYSDGSACRLGGGGTNTFFTKEWPTGIGWCWLVADAKKQLWFAKAGHVGVWRNQQFVPLTSLPDRLTCIGPRGAGGVWICSGKKLYRFVEGGAPALVAELPVAGEAVEPLVVFEDRDGAVWVGTGGNGLFRFDGAKTERVETSRGEIRSVTQDREGNIWVGTSGDGLNRLNQRALQLEGPENGLPFETVRSVGEEATGALWVVSQSGLVARSQGEGWAILSTNKNWPKGQASCIAADTNGTVWIGTTDNGLGKWSEGHCDQWHKTNGLASERVWTLMTDSADDLWISLGTPNCVQRLSGGKFETFDLPAGRLVVRAMVEDSAQVIWMGTEDGRLLRVDGTNLVDETAQTLAKPIPIRCLQATPDGSLWIGYAGAGLGRLKDGRFSRIGVEQGLPDEFISQMVAAGNGMLWFAGNRGIFEARETELDGVAEGRLERARPMLFGKNEGLTSLQANFGFGIAGVRTRDGRICFSMLTGLAIVNPKKIQANQLPPPIVIEKISSNGRTLEIPQASQLLGDELAVATNATSARALAVPAGTRELRIDFSVLSFTAPENVRVRYQLEGYDSGWMETVQRSATYSQLHAGDYRFRVIACNNSGVWNETGAALAFGVLPFFWQTWWFRLSLLVVLTAGFAGMGWYASGRRLRRQLFRLEQESAVQKDRARIAKDLHDDLGANLSQIAMLSELAQTDLEKPAQANVHLDQIFHTARLITRSLDEIVWAVNPRNDTLDRFVAHLCQFAPEYLRAAGIRSRLDMPMELPASPLAANVRHQLYLGFKETLHNVVKHAGATEVWLRLRVTAETITLMVEDNGRGFETETAPRAGEDGLVNLRHRMEEIGGEFRQESEDGKGRGLRLLRRWPENRPEQKNVGRIAEWRTKNEVVIFWM